MVSRIPAFFLFKLLGHITEKNILKMTKYNKKMQNLININPNYINGSEYNDKFSLIYSGGYLRGERHGYGEEFDEKGEIIFYGSYANGKKHGRVIEYYRLGERIITFEGNYSFGQRNGIGKEYINTEFEDEDKILFEGEYLKGKRWRGKGEEYDDFERLIYSGEYIDGKKWTGKLTSFNEDGKIANKVKFLNGKIMKGQGKEYDEKERLKYEGEYYNGKRNGCGQEYDEIGRLIFKGIYMDGERWNGKQIKYLNNLAFELEYISGVRLYQNEAIEKYDYNNNFITDLDFFTGKIKESYNNIQIFDGEYKDGLRNGKGIEYNIEGKIIFEGEYFNGKRKGKGKEFDNNGKIIFEGEYFK